METVKKPLEHIKEGPKTLSTAHKLFNKNYLLLWQGQLVSRMGSQVYSIVIALWIKHISESGSLSGYSGSLVGSFFMLTALPFILLSAFGGAVADRFSRKKIIVLSDVFNGLLVVTLGIIMYTVSYQTDWMIVAVFIVAMASSTITSFFGPAISASVPDLVPPKQLAAANSMGQLSQKISVFFGQGLGIPLRNLLGLPVLIILNGVTYLISAFSESFITIPQVFPEKVKGLKEYFNAFKSDLGEGWQFIKKSPGLKRLLTISVFTSFFTMPVIVLLMYYVSDHLHAREAWYGILLAIYGLGALIGYTIAGIYKPKGRKRTKVLVFFMLMESTGYILLPQAHNAIQAAVLFLVGGAFNGFVMVNIMTILQLTTPSNIRGRVFGTLTTISGSIAPLGMGFGGVLYDITGKNITLIYSVSGAIMIFLVLLITISRDFRRFVAFDLEETEPTGFTFKIRTLKEEEIKKDQKQLYLEYQLQKPRSEI